METRTGGREETSKIQFQFYFAVHVWLFALGVVAALMNFVLHVSKGKSDLEKIPYISLIKNAFEIDEIFKKS